MFRPRYEVTKDEAGLYTWDGGFIEVRADRVAVRVDDSEYDGDLSPAVACDLARRILQQFEA